MQPCRNQSDKQEYSKDDLQILEVREVLDPLLSIDVLEVLHFGANHLGVVFRILCNTTPRASQTLRNYGRQSFPF